MVRDVQPRTIFCSLASSRRVVVVLADGGECFAELCRRAGSSPVCEDCSVGGDDDDGRDGHDAKAAGEFWCVVDVHFSERVPVCEFVRDLVEHWCELCARSAPWGPHVDDGSSASVCGVVEVVFIPCFDGHGVLLWWCGV